MHLAGLFARGWNPSGERPADCGTGSRPARGAGIGEDRATHVAGAESHRQAFSGHCLEAATTSWLDSGTDAWVTVIGVVGDVRAAPGDEPRPTVYLPYWQRDRADFALVVRTAMDPLTLAPALRDAIHMLDRELVVPRPITLADVVDASVRQRRFQMSLVLAFAMAALLLAAIGVYGVVAQSVTHRTKEIGIRLALGAPKSHLLGNLPQAVWADTGGGGGWQLGSARRSGPRATSDAEWITLFGVPPSDPATYVAVSSVLLMSGLLACWLPASRAIRIDPMEALRQE